MQKSGVQAGDSQSRPYNVFDYFGSFFHTAVIIITYLGLLEPENQ